MILLLFFNLVFSSSWQNTIFGNEHNSKSYADGNIVPLKLSLLILTVGPPIKNTTWVTDIYFRSNSTTLEPLGYGIGPSYVLMFFLSVLKTNINDPSTWTYTTVVAILERDGGKLTSLLIYHDIHYVGVISFLEQSKRTEELRKKVTLFISIGHSIDEKGFIYLSYYQKTTQQLLYFQSPRLLKLNPLNGDVVWVYEDFVIGNISNPVVSSNGNYVSVCIDRTYIMIDSPGNSKSIEPESLCGSDASFLWGDPLFVCNAPNKKPLYCVDDDYCLSSNTRTFEADLIAKSKVDQNIFYILSKGKEEGGRIISNGTVSIMRKTVFPDYDCFIFEDKPKNEWESTVFLRDPSMIAVDSANGTDVILISTPTNSIQPINWITKAISWSKTPELLWSGTFHQGPSQNSFTYNIIENVVQKIDILEGKIIRKSFIPIPSSWKNKTIFSHFSFYFVGTASETVYILASGFPVDQTLPPDYGLVSLSLD